MSYAPLISGLTALSLLTASHGTLAQPVTLRAVTVELPGSDRALPPGPGAELVTNNCTACHSPGMILTQPALNKASWLGEVTKMRSTYKAPIADEDVEPIAAYLAALPVPQ